MSGRKVFLIILQLAATEGGTRILTNWKKLSEDTVFNVFKVGGSCRGGVFPTRLCPSIFVRCSFSGHGFTDTICIVARFSLGMLKTSGKIGGAGPPPSLPGRRPLGQYVSYPSLFQLAARRHFAPSLPVPRRTRCFADPLRPPVSAGCSSPPGCNGPVDNSFHASHG